MDLNATEHILFVGWTALWLMSVPIGWITAKVWPRLGGVSRRTILAVCLLSLALACCTVFSPWALRGFCANAANLGVAYAALSTLFWIAFRNRRKWLAVSAPLAINLVAAIPIFVGLVLSNNYIPLRQISLGHNLIARIYRQGFMGSNLDEAILVKQPPGLPLLEHRFYTRSIQYWECTETSARLNESASGDAVDLVCGVKVLDTVAVP